jgi:hypothetical protein
LASAVLPIGIEERRVVMIRAYSDESGVHDAPILTVAVYGSPDDQWDRFQREWRAILDPEGVRIFHAADFESRWGEFKGWDKQRAVAFQKRLLTTIRLRTQARISVSVNVADFAEIVAPIAKGVYGAYGFCLFQCLQYLALWLQKYAGDEPVAYFFEQSDNQGEIGRAMEFLLRHPEFVTKFHLYSYTFAPKSLEPLQAADLLAYETWKHVTNRVLSQGRAVRTSLENLMRAPHSGTYYDRKKLEEWVRDEGAELR